MGTANGSDETEGGHNAAFSRRIWGISVEQSGLKPGEIVGKTKVSRSLELPVAYR